MATSPIYSWPEPDNTDLVKNGALAIRTLGNAIDTTMGTMVAKTVVDAKGDLIAGTAADTVARLAVGTNGQVLKANSATATGLEWAADSAGMTNPMTTTGDTIYSSSGSTPARLGIGSTGQVLTVAGGVPSWATPASSASGLTLIASQTIGTTVSSVTVSSAFSSTYDNYLITLNGGVASTDINIRLTLGATAAGYYSVGYYMFYNSTTLNGIKDENIGFTTCGIGSTNTLMAQSIVQNPNLAKRTIFQNNSVPGSSTLNTLNFNGFLDNDTQYTAFTLTASTGTMTGGTVRVYGYQNS